MNLPDQMEAYIAFDDTMEDHADIRALLVAGATRIRELEAAQCKTHLAATMQLPCIACGREWDAHWKRSQWDKGTGNGT